MLDLGQQKLWPFWRKEMFTSPYSGQDFLYKYRCLAGVGSWNPKGYWDLELSSEFFIRLVPVTHEKYYTIYNKTQKSSLIS